MSHAQHSMAWERVSCSVGIAPWLGILSLAIGGCSDKNMADLKQYVQQVKSRPAETINPLPEMKPHGTFTYQAANLRSPFVPAGVALLRGPDTQAILVPKGIQPDRNRYREALERYPLDSLKMVGTLQQGDDIWALIRAPDGILYRLKEGNHLGQHYGRITHIDEERIKLIEIIPAEQGGWLERQAMLALAE